MVQEDLFVKPGVTIPQSELEFSVSRSGGPGGQHVNKTSTRVTLSWDISRSQAISEQQRERLLLKLEHRVTQEHQLQVHVDETRSQYRNRELALQRLAEIVVAALHVPKPRKKTKPSRSSQKKRMDKKTQRGQIKQARKKPTRQDW